MENYLLLMFPLPSKHYALFCSYQFLLVFQTAFFFFLFLLYKFVKNSCGCTRFIKSFQIVRLKNQMMLTLAIVIHSQFRNQIRSMCNIWVQQASCDWEVGGLNQSWVACCWELRKLLSSLTWWWCFRMKPVTRHRSYSSKFPASKEKK